MARPVIGIIGVGKVGETLARLLYQRGYAIGAVFNRHIARAKSLAQLVETVVVNDMNEVVDQCDLVMLTVSDDAIPLMVEELEQAQWTGKAVIHVSGAMSLDVLQPFIACDAMVGSLHPAYPFSSVESAVQGLIGASFAIEYADEALRQWLVDIISSLEGQVIEIPAGKKAQYHTALVIASNYMVTLYAVAEALLQDFSDDSTAIHQALSTLMSATMHNLIEQGIPDALTGPLVRADVGTIRAHLGAIAEHRVLREGYINLARLSYPLLTARGIDITEVEQLLRQEMTHASDDT